MGPPPPSGPLEPDNLQELRTTMEPIRDAVPQRTLTTTPASTTAGHAPDIQVLRWRAGGGEALLLLL